MNQKLVKAVDNALVEASTEEGFLSLGVFIAALRDQGYVIVPVEADEGMVNAVAEPYTVSPLQAGLDTLKALQAENAALREALRELQTRRGKSIAGRSANIAVVDEARRLTGESCSKCDGHGHIWVGEDVKPCPECN